MKTFLLTFLTLIPLFLSASQTDSVVFRGTLDNEEYQVYLQIDFVDNNIIIPDGELFGPLPGMLGSKKDSRIWLILSAKMKDEHTAVLSVINDYGSEDLVVVLTHHADDTFTLKQQEGSTLKFAVNGKWEKLPKELTFKRRK